MGEQELSWQASLPFYESGLFRDVQLARLFADSKTFADARPLSTWQDVDLAYASEKAQSGFSLDEFITAHFALPSAVGLANDTICDDVASHIELMWDVLTKRPDASDNSSLIPLPLPYIVPGGRFREIYYWDTYFTALGLMDSGRAWLAESMLNNFLHLQGQVGHVPNGNRSYYHTRSQPPILALMTDMILPVSTDDTLLARAYAGMEREYAFWMDGADTLDAGNGGFRRVTRMPDGSLLNRYYDDTAAPRPESYREDVEAAASLPEERRAQFYRDLRAACESGWDFSSRWLADPGTLTSMQTTRILPVDLNALMYRLESLLSEFAGRLGRDAAAIDYRNLADRRRGAIRRYLWQEQAGVFGDYCLGTERPSPVASAATCVPLFVGIATEKQAARVAGNLERDFLKAGGLVTTLNSSGQQWDSPNGWAPSQWFAVQGLLKYGHRTLAHTIMRRWLEMVEAYFRQHGAMLEKYNVCDPKDTAGGGEYEVQVGFGWTNGVTRAFMSMMENRHNADEYTPFGNQHP